MKVGEVWKLIDLDAAAKIGEMAGLKSSTGYVPPGTIHDCASLVKFSFLDHICRAYSHRKRY
jgi:hypothetical protein